MALQTFSFLFPIYIQGQPYLMIMMIINCFCGMVDRRKVFSLISSWDHCQRSSPSRISDTPRAGFEPAQNLSSGLVEWSCAVVITTTPRRQGMGNAARLLQVLHRFVYWKYLLSQKYQKVLVLFSLNYHKYSREFRQWKLSNLSQQWELPKFLRQFCFEFLLCTDVNPA